jgi:septal ring factor EnvC (AmiA/AmiB activator)
MIFLLSLLIANASASPMENGKVELLVEQMKATKTSLIKDEVKQRQVLGNLFEINRKMKRVVIEKTQLENERLLVSNSVKELAQKIMDLEEKSKEQKTHLRGRLGAIYKLGGQGLARILLTSASSAELERNLKILGLVAKQDMELIRSYTKLGADLESRKKKLNQRWAHLQALQQKITQRETLLTQDSLRKEEILSQVRKSHKVKLKKLSAIRKKSRRLAATDETGLLDNLFQPSFFEKKGQLPPPIDGKLVKGFGLLKDEIHNVLINHSGNFYSAPVGTPVKSIFFGTVAFAGQIPGFGETLILDHGDHYFSVYSHNQKLTVQEGDEVRQSQIIAHSGFAANSFGKGLYFEIRHFSEPADPLKWMKGTGL